MSIVYNVQNGRESQGWKEKVCIIHERLIWNTTQYDHNISLVLSNEGFSYILHSNWLKLATFLDNYSVCVTYQFNNIHKQNYAKRIKDTQWVLRHDEPLVHVFR